MNDNKRRGPLLPVRGRRRTKRDLAKMLDSVEWRWKKEKQMWWWHLFAMIFFVYLVLAVTTILVLFILEITKQ